MADRDKMNERIDELLASDPELKKVYEELMSLSGVDAADEDDEVEVEYIEAGGKTYIVAKEFLVKGTTYCHLVNEDDPLDFIYRKLSVEDGKEYLVPLDSDEELNSAMEYERRYVLRELKRKRELDEKNGGK